jgi:hypothetical protein
MGLVDIVLIAVIIAGAVYLLYRSMWKKKGYCPGCDPGTCDKKIKDRAEDQRDTS